jgi:GAF domain-containing protein/HAMP domain-containing protein
MVLILGLFLTSLIVRSLTAPIGEMIAAFQSIEKGDLSKRIGVTASDEIGQLGIYFNQMVARLSALQESLETQVKERTAQLRATVQVANAVSKILDADELIEQVVNLISSEFGYYYVALFLNDSSGKWAELRAATGDAGRVLRANNHRLEVGGRSMVGRAVRTREAVVAVDTTEGQIRFENPLLPYTRSEIALPLIVGDRVFGALDVQSTREADFDEQDIETLKTMANQVAVALENARLFQDAKQSLQDMRAIQRQYLLTSWKGFSEEKGVLSYEIGDTDPGESLSELQIPLSLRDQWIGEISLSAHKELTPEEKNMIQAIAAQAALALENARLVEESQSSARRDRLVAEVTGRIWASTTIDGILQTAVREMGRALETDEVTIELKMD